MWVAASLVSCGAADGPGDTAPSSDTASETDTAPPPAFTVTGVSSRLHGEFGTIAYIGWTQDGPGSVRIEASVDPDEWMSTPELHRDAGSWEQIVLGLPYDLEVAYRVLAGPALVAEGTFRTASLTYSRALDVCRPSLKSSVAKPLSTDSSVRVRIRGSPAFSGWRLNEMQRELFFGIGLLALVTGCSPLSLSGGGVAERGAIGTLSSTDDSSSGSDDTGDDDSSSGSDDTGADDSSSGSDDTGDDDSSSGSDDTGSDDTGDDDSSGGEVDADDAACAGAALGDACVRGDGSAGTCQPDESDPNTLECED